MSEVPEVLKSEQEEYEQSVDKDFLDGVFDNFDSEEIVENV